MSIFEAEDFGEIRKNRQQDNWNQVVESDLGRGVNEKALGRVVEYTGLTKNQLLSECNKGPLFAKVLSQYVAINSSRQGSADETYVIKGIAGALLEHGIDIQKCGTNDLVPIKGSSIIMQRSAAKKKYSKNQMLKSFDFRGNKGGTEILGFAKVKLGAGGHQDNVIHETDEVVKWAKKYGCSKTLFIFMIDTDNPKEFSNLKSNLPNNIFIGNHKEVQQWLIKR